jgi:hypothetical protein
MFVTEEEYATADNWLIDDMKKKSGTNKRKYTSHELDEDYQSGMYDFNDDNERSKNETNRKSTGNRSNDWEMDTEDVILDDNEKTNSSSIRGKKNSSKKRIVDTDVDDEISVDRSNSENLKNSDISGIGIQSASSRFNDSK